MAPPSTVPARTAGWWLLAALLPLLAALAVTFPAWLHPATTLPCHIVHPDCGGNQWLLAWVAERLLSLQSLLHNDRYYWPVGDAPFLAGNGGEGFLYAPLHALLGWPVAANVHALLLVAANGLAGAWAARQAGAAWPGVLLAGVAFATSPYAARELTAGRAAQADLAGSLLFLGAFLRLLDAPSARRAVLAAVLLAATSLLYWYHGWFLGIAALVLLVATAPGRIRAGRPAVPWRALAVLAGTAAILLAAPFAWWLSHWAALPGTAEVAAFPHPEAVADSLVPAWPFLLRDGRGVGQALPASVVALAAVALVRAALGRSDRPWLDLALAAVWAIFLILALGPAFRPFGVSPFDLLYGLAAPLRRFWWPSRHIVLASAALVLLAARALPAPRRPAAAVALGLGLAASIPACLLAQGTPWRVEVTRMTSWPPPFYEEVGRVEGSLVLELPLSPRVAVSQRHLVYALVHRRVLVTGHAPWVDRVRPSAWDAFVEGNTFLAGLRRVEEGDPSTTFTFDPADLEALRRAGLGAVVLNAEHYPLVRGESVRRLHRLLVTLFTKPRARMTRAWAWDAATWTGASSVPLLPWEPSAAERAGLAQGATPIAQRTPESEIFVPPDKAFDAPPPRDGAPPQAQ